MGSLATVLDFPQNLYQKRMLACVKSHGGYRPLRVATGVREVLRIKGDNIPLDWLKSDVCVYYRTANYLYLGIVEKVVQDKEWILLVCYQFKRVIVNEETPDLERGTNLVTVSSKDVRLLEGKAIVGSTMYPSLPS